VTKQSAKRKSSEKWVKTSIMMAPSLRKRLKLAAIEKDRDMGELLADALEAYLGKSISHRAN
jgi:hypothetical protein